MLDSNPDNNNRDSLVSADENRRMFDRIAGCYDFTNRALTFGLDAYWRNVAIKALNPAPRGHYLDIGCGTGDMAIKIVKRIPDAKVTGIDPSQGMLQQGGIKVAKEAMEDAVRLEKGDVLELRFPENYFDGAITAFCIRNVTNRKKALTEIHRSLKQGAPLVILELTDPDGAIMKPLFRLYSRIVMPVVTKALSSSSAYRYLTDSMAAFPRAEAIKGLMNHCGFNDLEHKRMTGGIVTLFKGTKA
jgi:demethylmenaquinone methyltransferase/2-methoxy-6-polyprenyl-1,4-benzoquinol methylase